MQSHGLSSATTVNSHARRSRLRPRCLEESLLGLALLTFVGAAAAASGHQQGAPALEVVDSSRLHLSDVRLSQSDEQLTLRGRAARPVARRGLIPGAVRVTLLDAAGQPLVTRTVRPMRPNRQATFARFFVQLAKPDSMPEGARVLVAAVPAAD